MRKTISARTSEETRDFYNNLIDGNVSRSIWGKDRRFNPTEISRKSSVKKHFAGVIERFLSPSDLVLDLGCGPGGFVIAASPYCREIIGADITPNFIDVANRAFADHGIKNARAERIEPGPLPYADASFDAVIMVDTIHHLDDAPATMDQVYRVLKPGGMLLIFEPNKRNPALWLMCLLDTNEHGLLRLGTASKYQSLLGPRYEIAESEYNGLLIGPDGRFAKQVADTVSKPAFAPWLGWLSPKLFIAARKRK